MDAKRILVVCLAILVVTIPGVVNADDVHKQTANTAGSSLGLGAPLVETAYHALDASQVDVIDPYKKVNLPQYRDALSALSDLKTWTKYARAALAEMKGRTNVTQADFDTILAKYPNAKTVFARFGITLQNFKTKDIVITEAYFNDVLSKYANAKTAFSKLGITYSNYDTTAIGPMYARVGDPTRPGNFKDYWKFLYNDDWRVKKGKRSSVDPTLVGQTKMVLAIDKTKPGETSSHVEKQNVEIPCPEIYESLYLPACAYCANWTTAQTDDWFKLQWSNGGIYVVGAGLYGVGAKGSPTACCTPQVAGRVTKKQKGPCYANVPITVWDPEVVSVVKYPAQLVPVNGELVWKVTVPGNQISPDTGEDLGTNEFVTQYVDSKGRVVKAAPDLAGDTSKVKIPVNPETGQPLTSTEPPTVGSPDGSPVTSGTFKQPKQPKRRK